MTYPAMHASVQRGQLSMRARRLLIWKEERRLVPPPNTTVSKRIDQTVVDILTRRCSRIIVAEATGWSKVA